MLRNAESTRLHIKIPRSTLGLMVSKPAGLLVTEEVIQDGLHSLPDTRNRFARATMGDQSTHVLQKESGRLLCPDDFLYVEKKRPASVGKTLLMPRLAKGLAREASAKDIKGRDTGLGVHLGDIPLEILIVIYEQCLVGTMVEVMPIGLTGCRIPLAGEYALRALRVVESDVKSPDAGEKIYELVGGLLGHTPPNHIQI